MKWLVNGEEVEFDRADHEIRERDGLLFVKTSEGWKSAAVVRVGSQTLVSFEGRQYSLAPVGKSGKAKSEAAGSGDLRAPIPGVVVAVNCAVGDCVEKGKSLLVLEAMKTQIPILSPFDGELTKISVVTGDQVSANQPLAEVKP